MANLALGQEVDGLEILQAADSSRRGTAFKVRDIVTYRVEYLKRLPPVLDDDDDLAQRFMREARLHSSLSHPNIAQFYSVRHIENELVMTREWVDGEPLSVRMAVSPLDLFRAVDYIGQALDALAYAHGRGVVHRNVTAENLLIADNGVVKLIGFELARGNTDPKLTQVGMRKGSAHYMAPEQVKGLINADERSDIYAVGVVLYQAITGRKPFEGMGDFDVMQAQVESPIEPPSRYNPDVSPELTRVVMKALEKDRDLRYQSAADFHEDLTSIARRRWDEATADVPSAELPLDLPEAQPIVDVEAAEPNYQAPVIEEMVEWKPGQRDMSRTLGYIVIGTGVGALVVLAGMILLNS